MGQFALVTMLWLWLNRKVKTQRGEELKTTGPIGIAKLVEGK